MIRSDWSIQSKKPAARGELEDSATRQPAREVLRFPGEGLGTLVLSFEIEAFCLFAVAQTGVNIFD